MIGTIGGGCVEAEVWNAAREVIETEKPQAHDFSLGQDAAYDNGLICGGQLDVFVEPVIPPARALLFSAAATFRRACAKSPDLAGFSPPSSTTAKPSPIGSAFPKPTEIYADEYEEVFPKLTVNDPRYLIIVTRGHRDDMRVLRWAVATPARYIAMIGSKRKVISVVKELEKEGLPREAVERIYAPMGLEIGADSPEEIAISVAAEMIAVRRDPEATGGRLSKSIFADELFARC